MNADDIFTQIYVQYGFPPNWYKPQGFITMAQIIIGQQVSLESADAHYNKLNNYLPEFSPEEIVKLSDKQMRECQISRQKSNYLCSLSAAILEGKVNLEKLPELEIDEVRSQLKTIKGIGDWTVDIYLMFCLQSKDIFPAGDVAAITAIKELSSVSSIDKIILSSEKWKPYRSLATFFLWHYYLKKRNRNYVL